MSNNAGVAKGGPKAILKTVYEFVELLAFTVAAVLLLTLFVCRHSVVVGDSMINTLKEGEHLIISDLFYKPQTGDIVVFDDVSVEDKSKGESSPLIKRVIAVGGQHVSITEQGIYVDGEKLSEPYVYTGDFYFGDYLYEELELDVPEGSLFVMGDHRNNSLDSRAFGVIDEGAVLGRVLFRLLPFTIYSRS